MTARLAVDNNLLGGGQDQPGGHNLLLFIAPHTPLDLDLGERGAEINDLACELAVHKFRAVRTGRSERTRGLAGGEARVFRDRCRTGFRNDRSHCHPP